MEQKIRYDQRYQTLAVVRKANSFTDAGAILSLTPSAVAHQVHSIEEELGVTLFQRDGKRLIPTRECELVAGYVERISMLCEKMDRDLTALRGRFRRLVIGITPSLESGVLSQALARYQAGADSLRLTVTARPASVLEKMLRSSLIDLAVADRELPAGEFGSILMDTDYLVAAVPNGSPYAAGGTISIDQLRREPLILRAPESGTRSLFEANLGRLGLTLDAFRVKMEVESVDTIKRLVAEDYGMSILSNSACVKDVAMGRFRTVTLRNMSMVRDIHIFYRRDFRHDALIRALRQLYDEALSD